MDINFKNKNNETLPLKLPLIGIVLAFHLFGYYLEYITESTHALELQGEVDKWEINIFIDSPIVFCLF
jgi:hypothetical protein